MTAPKTFILINTLTRQTQSKPLPRRIAQTMADQLNSIMGAGVIVVAPAGWEAVGLN
ncbi:hypothetical protein [Methylobacterium platani]|uniref:hypothetical protein n=1 Tax=Methylobacterium platani TaxID=427683 RepID=UPI000AE40ECF|nr:hypothetical protein [Methylobacterium platani]